MQPRQDRSQAQVPHKHHTAAAPACEQAAWEDCEGEYTTGVPRKRRNLGVCDKDQMWMFSHPTARRSPSRMAIECTGRGNSSTLVHARVFTSSRRTVLSSQPLTSRPSGSTTSARTLPSTWSKVATGPPLVAASQMRTMPSSLPLAKRLPPRATTQFTSLARSGSLSLRRRCSVPASQTPCRWLRASPLRGRAARGGETPSPPRARHPRAARHQTLARHPYPWRLARP